MQTEQDFKDTPRLRWRIDQEDQSVIAYALAYKFRHDFLYFHGPSQIGLYYRRGTKNGATLARLAWMKRLKNAKEHAIGDFDGILVADATLIPKEFLKAKRGRSFAPSAIS
jgi:hypothetical protein